MDPNVWGPHGWFFIQSCILNMPEAADPGDYVNFLYSLRNVLPCEECRKNYAEWLRNNPIPAYKEGMIKWVIDLQNSIRKKKGLVQRTRDDIVSFYNNPNKTVIAVIILILFLYLI